MDRYLTLDCFILPLVPKGVASGSANQLQCTILIALKAKVEECQVRRYGGRMGAMAQHSAPWVEKQPDSYSKSGISSTE